MGRDWMPAICTTRASSRPKLPRGLVSEAKRSRARACYVTETNDFYELVVERHRQGATVLTSNRDPSEFLAQMADPLLAQSAVDRLQSAAYELVIEGESYRKRQKPAAGRPHDAPVAPGHPRAGARRPK